MLEAFYKIEKAGGQATLSVSTSSGKTKVKLVTATTAAPLTESPSTSTSSSPARRHRRRGARARARRNQRAAAHQAKAATSAILEAPPRPLHILPSPPPASGRRRVMSVGRPDMPTFSSLNLDGNPSDPPSSPLTSPLINPWIPCKNNCDIPDEHCGNCFKCTELCSEHEGCSCDPTREYRIVPSPLDHTRYIIGSKDLWCTQCKQELKT